MFLSFLVRTVLVCSRMNNPLKCQNNILAAFSIILLLYFFLFFFLLFSFVLVRLPFLRIFVCLLFSLFLLYKGVTKLVFFIGCFFVFNRRIA